MPLSTSAFIQDLRAELVAALPELSATGIFEAEHVEQVAWEELTLPFGVIVASNFQEWSDGPADGNIFQCRVEIWYALQISGPSSGLRTKLETIIDLYYPNDPTPIGDGQVLGILGFDYSDDLRPNQLFMAGKRQARAGVVRLNCLVGELP